MGIKAKRWNDPIESDDGFRLLVCRYRPRGVQKDEETWDAFLPNLGPSRALHADFYGKHGPPIEWTEYEIRYLREIAAENQLVGELARRVRGGETITLLCSSACTNERRCHRTLLKEAIEKMAAKYGAKF
jgi:uncharacterized protein YeaO (DUF488 family)